VLLFVAMLAVAVTGYGFGLGGFRGPALRSILAALVAIVLTLIIDLDRPRRGLIRVGEQNLASALDSMKE